MPRSPLKNLPEKTAATGISMADDWALKVAKRSYELAQRTETAKRYQLAWERLPKENQRVWYWHAKLVMQALDQLE